ncbi:MAG: hypothetical protein D6725_13935 [Planctomycetota bacterium]|nr:MAG: hypothetical protein D6725_13935 [Planctomycetota bacterium]
MRHDRITIHRRGPLWILDMGPRAIWDGADMALLRDTLAHVIGVQAARSIAIDMKHVIDVPSGFFGMLYQWAERGVRVGLLHPPLHVQRMLWFRQFLEPTPDPSFYRLVLTPAESVLPDEALPAHTQSATRKPRSSSTT